MNQRRPVPAAMVAVPDFRKSRRLVGGVMGKLLLKERRSETGEESGPGVEEKWRTEAWTCRCAQRPAVSASLRFHYSSAFTTLASS